MLNRIAVCLSLCVVSVYGDAASNATNATTTTTTTTPTTTDYIDISEGDVDGSCTEGKHITIARSPPASSCPADNTETDAGEGGEGVSSPHFDRSCSGPLHPFVLSGSHPEDEADHGTITIEGDDTEYVASGLTITEDMIIYIDYDGIVAAEYTPECDVPAENGDGSGEVGEGGEGADDLACPFASCAKSFIWSDEFCATSASPSSEDACDCWCPRGHGRVNGTGACVPASRTPDGVEECGLGGVRTNYGDTVGKVNAVTYYAICDCFDGFVNGIAENPLDPRTAKPCIDTDSVGDARGDHLIDATTNVQDNCQPDESGPNCEFSCSNDGRALFDGSCSCKLGWGGPNCEAQGSADCNGNGESIPGTSPMQCRCFADWKGDKCAFCSDKQRKQAVLDDDEMYGTFYNWGGALLGISLFLILFLTFYEYRRYVHKDDGLKGFQCLLPEGGQKKIVQETWYPTRGEALLIAMLLLRLFDFMSNWAFYSISAKGKLFQCDLRDQYSDNEEKAAKAPGQYTTAILFFTVLGTLFFIYDMVDLFVRRRATQKLQDEGQGEKAHSLFTNVSPPLGIESLEKHRQPITASTVVLDDLPQIILTGFFVSTTIAAEKGRQGCEQDCDKVPIDSITMLSLVLSIFSAIFALTVVFFGDKLEKPFAKVYDTVGSGFSRLKRSFKRETPQTPYGNSNDEDADGTVVVPLNNTNGAFENPAYDEQPGGEGGDAALRAKIAVEMTRVKAAKEMEDMMAAMGGGGEDGYLDVVNLETKVTKEESFGGFEDADPNHDANINGTKQNEAGTFNLEHELKDVGADSAADVDIDGTALTGMQMDGFDAGGGVDL